ncbi:hypothetical protein PMI07_000846 [Rhizobium sp. CF080]|uniref:hypothetical protein n=1 Tax=Rhizobium sp. (strain CF080) TaxID=1144310 RepID=UPI000271BCBC|nr:hypothetical protein [Rhizobium sp. CF080]EUB97270.1 hypothetical protein PMI07_000846 [Rhizobium sp. CF080]
MVDPARIRHRITEIYIAASFSTKDRIYIDFSNGRAPRWYAIYMVEQRVFGTCTRLSADGVGTIDVPDKLREYLISIIPPHIIANCTAASLGVAT